MMPAAGNDATVALAVIATAMREGPNGQSIATGTPFNDLNDVTE